MPPNLNSSEDQNLHLRKNRPGSESQQQNNEKTQYGATYPRLDGETGPLPMIYDGKWYDLSNFYEVHPGGVKHLKLRKNKDITKAFHTSPHPHTKFALHWLEQFKVTDPTELSKLPKIDEDGVDWDKGMIFRVYKIKKYNEWIDKVVHRPLRLFDSPVLESLTVCKWWVVPLVWVPIITYLTLLTSQIFSLMQTFNLFIFGVFAWTLIEYTLHKYLFHIKVYDDSGAFKKTLHFAIHGQHHKNPFDPGRLVFPPVPAAILTSMIYGLCRIIIPYEPMLGILAGGLLGYVSYDMCHYYLHHGKPKRGSYIWKLAQHHNRHHFEDFTHGLGITNFYWDEVFNSSLGSADTYNGKGVDFKKGRELAGLDPKKDLLNYE